MKQKGGEATQQIHCLLLNQFSLLSCASITEPFLACNQLCGEPRYNIRYAGYGELIQSDGLASMQVDINLNSQAANYSAQDTLIICGGMPGAYKSCADLNQDLLNMKRHYQRIVGVATGGLAMAEAGLLNHKKASIHWWNTPALHKMFPDVILSKDIFSIDGNLATCRGGSSAMDLGFVLIGQDQGSDMVEALSDYFLRERLGVSGNQLPHQSSQTLTAQHPKLDEAIVLMENNIEEPLSTEEVARHIQLSIRQFERLFKQHMHSSPSQYYLYIRLENARELLLTSQTSITDIALACGFSSTAHFSTRYRHQYGLTPTEDRSLQNN